MKLVKSLLLGATAAIAVAGAASAADLPAAEPVEYVRICDAYGAGFFFIPGTDTCLRISGLVRVQAFIHANNNNVTNYTGFPGNIVWPQHFIAGEAAYSIGNGPVVAINNTWTSYTTPFVDQLDMGVRALLRFDARSRTEWGILRSFFEFNADSATNAINGTPLQIRYGFVQFGPVTAGLTDSFFNFDNGTYYGDVMGDRTSRVVAFAYTASFGNGISATIALEDATVAAGAGQAGIGGTTASINSASLPTQGATRLAQNLPDLVGNIRVAQAWGTAQLSAVVGQARFRDTVCDVNGVLGAAVCSWEDTYWAIKGGLRVNLDMLARGSHFQIQATYGQGAVNYVFTGAGNQSYWQSNQLVNGLVDETVLNRIDSWSIFANLVHFFTPAFRGSVYGGFVDLRYNGTAATLGYNTVVLDSAYTIGVNFQWTPVRNLDLGVDVFYTNARVLAVDGTLAGPLVAPGTVSARNEDSWGAIFRIQRSF